MRSKVGYSFPPPPSHTKAVNKRKEKKLQMENGGKKSHPGIFP